MIWLHNSRIYAAFAVVFLHTSALFIAKQSIGSENWWYGNIFDSAVRWCVPVFVMISGMLLLSSQKNESTIEFYRKRYSRILPPLFFWSIFYIIWPYIIGNSSAETSMTTKKTLLNLLSGTPYYHMWFLYMIAGLYLFVPFLKTLTRNSTRKELGVFALCAIALAAAGPLVAKAFSQVEKGFALTLFIEYIPYFIIGYLVGQDKKSRSKSVLICMVVASCAMTALGCYLLKLFLGSTSNSESYFYNNLSITVIPMSVSVFYLFKHFNRPFLNKTITQNVSSLTLGIYLIHPAILDVIGYKYETASWLALPISVPIITVVVFALSLVTAWGMQQVNYLRRAI